MLMKIDYPIALWRRNRCGDPMSAVPVNQVVVVGQSGEWLVRENDQYDLFSSKKKPNWSDHSFEELFEMAFDGFVIDDEDHPLVEKFKFI